jgi:hypothetical protein
MELLFFGELEGGVTLFPKEKVGWVTLFRRKKWGRLHFSGGNQAGWRGELK